MTRCWLLAWALLISLLAVVFPGSASTPVEALLARAETVRSSDPVQLGVLLAEVTRRKHELTESQQDHLTYLDAYHASFTGDYAQAIQLLKSLAANSKSLDARVRAGTLLVNIHTKNRQFADGLRQLESVLKQIDLVTDKDLQIHAFTEAAYIHNQIGQYRMGLQYADRILERAPHARGICFANQLRTDALFNLGILPRDDTPIIEAIDQCAELGETVPADMIRVTLARKWAQEAKRQQAISLLKQHMNEVEATRYLHLVVMFKATLARLLLDTGDLGGAENYASETISQSANLGNTFSLASAYHTMYEVAQNRGDDAQALVYYRRYSEADKAYLNEVKARELAYQLVRQETLEKSQQIQRLDSQNQLLKLQRRIQQQSSQNTRLIVVLLVLLLASIAYWAYKTKRVQMSLKRLAETDALTGICNRHHFNLQAELILLQCARNDEVAALIMFDLDHFKNINDSYGHQVGDWVLRRVAEACGGLVRKADTFGRIGGEEFALLIRGCNAAAAARLADECRMRIAAIDTAETGSRFTVTASFGVTTTAESGGTLQGLFSHADRMLYRSKNLGRNQVSVWEGGLMGNTVAAMKQEPSPRMEGIVPGIAAQPFGSN